MKAGTQAGTKMNLASKGIKHLQSDMRSGGRRYSTQHLPAVTSTYRPDVYSSIDCMHDGIK